MTSMTSSTSMTLIAAITFITSINLEFTSGAMKNMKTKWFSILEILRPIEDINDLTAIYVKQRYQVQPGMCGGISGYWLIFEAPSFFFSHIALVGLTN